MTNTNIQDRTMMPEFTIDTIVTDSGKEIPGIKRMYDIALAINDSIMQWGAPGIGKSQAVYQWNAEKVEEYNKRIAAGEKIKPWNPQICDVRLSMKEPVDMVGVPIPTKDEKGNMTTVWATPSVWPKGNDYAGGVIHLDEMNQGQAAILNAAFQLIQDRALGEYKVPEGYLIIASSNPSAYNSTVTELSVPLSNRFSHFNIKPDFDSWLNYRMNNGGNLDVMTFLKTQGIGMLFDEESMRNKVGSLSDAVYTSIVVTPRSWEVVEKVLSLPDGNKNTGGFSIDEKQRYATGRLGLALTTKLFTYLKDKTKYQDWHEILVDGKDFRDESAEQFWAVQMACMATIFNEKDDTKCRQYILNLLEATRHLKSVPYKIINITQLSRAKRLAGAFHVFNPVKDAKDMIALATKSFTEN